MFKAVRALPYARLLAALQVAMLARRHLHGLPPGDRRRLLQLVRHGHHLTAAERRELRDIAGKLDARAFATDAARTFSPLGRGPKGAKRR